MFEPEALGLSGPQFQQFAAALVTPALGFLFLYLLGLPLKKMPFFEVIEDYKPPAWVLPLFALGSLLALSSLASAAFFLNYFQSNSDIGSFLAAFFYVYRIETPANKDQIEQAYFTLNDYDGYSNFRILVNGYELSPLCHPAMGRVPASFEPCWLGDATGRGAEPSMWRSVPSRCIAGALSLAKAAGVKLPSALCGLVVL